MYRATLRTSEIYDGIKLVNSLKVGVHSKAPKVRVFSTGCTVDCCHSNLYCYKEDHDSFANCGAFV